jgi:ATP-dependent protease ClpP protease subunit
MLKICLLALLLAVPSSLIIRLTTPEAPAAVAKAKASSIVFFQGDVDDATLTSVKNEIGATGSDRVTLVITSTGGNVLTGLTFIQDVERMRLARPALRIRCIADIVAASMAAVIFESDVCDTRLVTNRTVIIFHNVQASQSPIKTALDFAITQMVAPRLGMTPEAYAAKLATGDWVMNAYQAAEAHAADSVAVLPITDEVDGGTP